MPYDWQQTCLVFAPEVGSVYLPKHLLLYRLLARQSREGGKMGPSFGKQREGFTEDFCFGGGGGGMGRWDFVALTVPELTI